MGVVGEDASSRKSAQLVPAHDTAVTDGRANHQQHSHVGGCLLTVQALRNSTGRSLGLQRQRQAISCVWRCH